MDTSPKYLESVEELPRRFFIGIQGAPGSGKSAASLTFPNPIFCPFDRTDIKGLIESCSHLTNVKPLQIPFHKKDFIADVLGFKEFRKKMFYDIHGALSKWLNEEGVKLTPDKTLIIDSWSTYQDHLDNWIWGETIYTNAGQEDHFAYWDMKIDLSKSVINLLQNLACNVVVIFHESQERNKVTGELLEKTQPLMQGKFVTKLKMYFPYFVRQLCDVPRDNVTGKPLEGQHDPIYLWQIKSTDKFDAKWIGAPARPIVIPAHYKCLGMNSEQLTTEFNSYNKTSKMI